jgi:rhodanese-related sulfurtransferase
LNLYVFDARQVPEYRAGHVAGSAALPGALAVQRTDEFIPVRHGRVVFIDDDGVRANLAAAWLARMGLSDVWVLEGGVEAWRASGRPLESGRKERVPAGLDAARAAVTWLAAPAVDALLAAEPDALVIDVGTSRDVERAHLAAAAWIPRGWLELRIGAAASGVDQAIVVTARDEAQSVYAAATLGRLGYRRVFVLEGGTGQPGPLPVASGLPVPPDTVDDVILPPYAKGEAGMRNYLAWELALTRPS